MSDQYQQVEPEIGCYRSGVAARLTGVPVETLRVWERRYGVVGPRLSESGQRLYSSNDVHRLGIIKRLVDAGHAIGSIATLPIDTLLGMADVEKNAAHHPGAPALASDTEVSIALIGPWIASPSIDHALSRSSLNVVGRCLDLHCAAAELDGIKADLVVIELPILDEASITTINQIRHVCNASRGIILYRFSRSAVLQELRAAGYEAVRKPLDSVEVEWLCNALMKSSESAAHVHALQPMTSAPPAARFDENGLAALAGGSSGIYCECPRHLVELILSLNSFEKYSADCANRDSRDAALHRDLQWTTGYARAALENALLRLAQAEGIALPGLPALPVPTAD